jgi:hypothetical protein
MIHPDSGGPTPTENPSKLSMRKVLAGHLPSSEDFQHQLSRHERNFRFATRPKIGHQRNRTERVSEDKIEIGSSQSKTMGARRDLWAALQWPVGVATPRTRRPRTFGNASTDRNARLAFGATMRAVPTANRCEQKILRAELEVRRGTTSQPQKGACEQNSTAPVGPSWRHLAVGPIPPGGWPHPTS